LGHIPGIVWSAWSLGTEVQFYAVTPLLLILPFPAVAVIAFASLYFQVDSYYIQNLDMAGYWAFRTSYGTFYIYCMGVCFARRADIRYAGLLGAIIVSQLLLLLVFYPLFRPFAVASVMEISIGTLVVVPIVGFADRFKSRWWEIWDYRIGCLSYPIFLCHLIGMYLADEFFPGDLTSKQWVLCSMGSCLVLSVLMHWLVEVPAERVRYWIRGFRSLQMDKPVPASS
jgi:peptidoglycan/LPS O-acetylase OafA/YrhL